MFLPEQKQARPFPENDGKRHKKNSDSKQSLLLRNCYNGNFPK